MSGKKEGTGGGHRVKEASQVTIIGSPEVGSGQLSRKKTPSLGILSCGRSGSKRGETIKSRGKGELFPRLGWESHLQEKRMR